MAAEESPEAIAGRIFKITMYSSVAFVLAAGSIMLSSYGG